MIDHKTLVTAGQLQKALLHSQELTLNNITFLSLYMQLAVSLIVRAYYIDKISID